MRKRIDYKNTLIACLLVTVLIMSVGFALLSSTLTITTTGTISGDWKVQFKSDSLEQLSKTTGVDNVSASIDASNMSATISANFEKPGDSVSYKIAVENAGTIDAYLKSVDVTGEDTNSEAIKMSYEVKNNTDTNTYAQGSIIGNTPTKTLEPATTSTLNKKNGDAVENNYVYVTLEYVNTTTGVTLGEEATYTLTLNYEQTAATTNAG